MILGIGTDITSIERIKQAVLKNKLFVDRILTDKEEDIYNHSHGEQKYTFLAGRFSAKESVSKAFGTGIGKFNFKDIEILKNDLGQPIVTTQFNDCVIHISISHSDEFATSMAILEKKE